MFPRNSLLGATIETNRDSSNISKALSPVERFEAMLEPNHPHKFIVVEPHLRLRPEPPLEKTLKLVKELKKVTEVRGKTLRKAWYES